MRTDRRTARGRVILGVVIAFVLPSIILAFGVSTSEGPLTLQSVLGGIAMAVIIGPIVGAFFGFPYVAAACMAWWALHQGRYHFVGSALVVGLVTGAAVAFFNFANFGGGDGPVLIALSLGAGGLTGYAVWAVAYANQKPFNTKINTSAFD